MYKSSTCRSEIHSACSSEITHWNFPFHVFIAIFIKQEWFLEHVTQQLPETLHQLPKWGDLQYGISDKVIDEFEKIWILHIKKWDQL